MVKVVSFCCEYTKPEFCLNCVKWKRHRIQKIIISWNSIYQILILTLLLFYKLFRSKTGNQAAFFFKLVLLKVVIYKFLPCSRSGGLIALNSYRGVKRLNSHHGDPSPRAINRKNHNFWYLIKINPFPRRITISYQRSLCAEWAIAGLNPQCARTMGVMWDP